MKKMIAMVLCLVLALSLVGCGGKLAEKTNITIPPKSEQEIELENEVEKAFEEELKKGNEGVIAGGVDMPNNSEVIDTEKTQDVTMENNGASQEVIILKEPPALTVICGENNSVEALKGTYSWTYLEEDGTGIGINADSMHPLEAKEYMPYFVNPNPSKVNLQWDIAPDMISVCCWNEEDWGQPDAKSEELEVLTLMVDSNIDIAPIPSIQLKDGNHIYEVIAEWNSSEKYNGTVCYSFYTVQQPK